MERSVQPERVLISARELTSCIFREKVRLAVAFAIPVVIALILSLRAVPIFEASTSLLIKSGREYQPGTDTAQPTQPAGPSLTKQEAVNSEIEIMSNRSIVAKTIERVGVSVIFPNMTLPAEEPGRTHVLGLAVDAFYSALSVKPVKLSEVISVSFQHRDPAVAIEVLEVLTDLFLERHVKIFSSANVALFQTQLDQINGQIADIETQRNQLRQASGLFLIDQQRANLINARSLVEKEVLDAENRRADLQQRVAHMRQAKPQLQQTEVTTETDRNDVTILLRTQLQQLHQTEQELLARLQPTAPEVQSVRQQIADAERRVKGMRDQMDKVRTEPSPVVRRLTEEIVMAEAELPALDSRLANLRAALAASDEQLRKLEGADKELRSYDNQLEALRQNAKTYRDRLEEARVMADLDRSHLASVSVVQPPLAGGAPVKPKRILYVGIGVIFGFVASGFVLLLSILTRNTLISTESVERIMRLPVLVSISYQPDWPALGAAGAAPAAVPPPSALSSLFQVPAAWRPWTKR